MTQDEQYYYYLGRMKVQEIDLKTAQDAYEEKLQYVRSTIVMPQIIMDKVAETCQALMVLINDIQTIKAALDADTATFGQIKAALGK